jgi:predicted P-loop ATPase
MIDIPPPGERPDGWDVADAIAEGWTAATLTEYLREQARPWHPPPAAEPAAGPAEPVSTPSGAGAGEEKKAWIPDLIWGRDGLKNCLSNVYQVLAHSSAWRGVVAYDEFALCVVKRRAPPYEQGAPGEWDSTDDSRTALWLARLNPDWGFTPSSDMVAEAIEVLARAHAFHPVRDYLAGLKWDGKKRLNGWLSHYLGVAVTPYTTRVARWWLMGAVRRVMQPGCKFDYCLVLEGIQGKGKSLALSILGGAWFGDTDLDLTHKDSMSALRGKLIYEIAEMGALVRSEEKRQKSFLSRTTDEYRPVYGRREIKAPRQVVFAGSTNEFEWNKDPTGGRRFWAVECEGAFDLDGLRSVRDQLFAEAYAAVLSGEINYPSAEEQREIFDPEQLKIEMQEGLIDWIHDWVHAQVSDFSMADVVSQCLKLDASKLTRDLQTRLGTALKKLGCGRAEKRNGMIRRWYKPPERNEASSKPVTSRPDWEDDDVPL